MLLGCSLGRWRPAISAHELVLQPPGGIHFFSSRCEADCADGRSNVASSMLPS